jgi:GntR family transcriptional regulator, vanillate catabolism transcriptional regulator
VPRGNAASSQTTKATLGLRELIFDGELAPGRRVPEVTLAQRLGVSRTPMRIALTTLAHEGLLEPLRGGGFVVRSFTRREIVDAIELRGVLEGTAARFAAERLASQAELAPLQEASAGLDEVVEGTARGMVVRYVPLNEAFHAGLVRLAKSPPLERALANVTALPFASPSALLASHERLPRSREILVVAQHQHRVLIEAIREGHGARAEEVAREHARLAQLNLELVLADQTTLDGIPGAPLLRTVSDRVA